MMLSTLSILFLSIFAGTALGACNSCLVDMTMTGLPLGLRKAHRTSGSTLSNGARLPSFNGKFDSPAIRFLVVRKLMMVAYDNMMSRTDASLAMPMPNNGDSVHINCKWAGGLFLEELTENDNSLQKETDEGEMIDNSADSKSENGGEEIMSGSMIMAIGFYKHWISPLLPPACRFLPTCSQYGAQAIKEFGPNKGLILTAWRLARCSPFGGRGYDPPKWPPVAYTYGSY